MVLDANPTPPEPFRNHAEDDLHNIHCTLFTATTVKQCPLLNRKLNNNRKTPKQPCNRQHQRTHLSKKKQYPTKWLIGNSSDNLKPIANESTYAPCSPHPSTPSPNTHATHTHTQHIAHTHTHAHRHTQAHTHTHTQICMHLPCSSCQTSWSFNHQHKQLTY